MITPPATTTEPTTTSMVRLRWLTIGIWLFWILVYWNGGEKGVTDLRKAWENKRSRLDLAAMGGIITFSLPIIGSITSKAVRRELHTTPDLGRTGTLIGVLLTGAGVAAMSISRSYLGQFWATHAEIQSDHDIVDHGPYGWVRHPIYTSGLAIYTGTALVFPSRRNVILALLVCLSYAIKAEAEEQLLVEHIPGYAAYQAQVRARLLPGLW